MVGTGTSASRAAEPFASRARVGKFRWLTCGMLFVVTVSNYIDRQAISIIAPVISAQFHLSNSDIAMIVSAFLIAYTFGQSFAGMQQSFNMVFIIAGILPLVALVIILTLTGKIELMRLPGITEEAVPASLAGAS